jgi:hypothetical protein
MTKNASFKKKIRDRMKKTGERYAAARLALLQQSKSAAPPKSAEMLAGYELVRGVHDDTALLAKAMSQSGVVDPATKMAFTEAKLYGLTGGIGFMYFLFEYKGHPPMLTFNCRTWTMPGPLLERALGHAGIEAEVTQTGAAKTAQKKLDVALDQGKVAHLTVDLATLPWAGVPEIWKGQMPRQLNVIGRAGEDYLVDVGGPRVITAADLAAARAAARKEKHRQVTFAAGTAATAPLEAARAAMGYTAKSYVEAPFKNFQNNFGLKGMRKAATLMGDAKDKKSWSKVFSTGPFAFRALLRTWECATLELTAPAGGRPFYGQFLREVAQLRGLAGAKKAGALADESGELFAQLSEDALELGGKDVRRATELSEEIEELRRSDDANTADLVRAASAERDALADGYEMGAEARMGAFARLAERMAAIAEVEEKLADALAALSS